MGCGGGLDGVEVARWLLLFVGCVGAGPVLGGLQAGGERFGIDGEERGGSVDFHAADGEALGAGGGAAGLEDWAVVLHLRFAGGLGVGGGGRDCEQGCHRP